MPIRGFAGFSNAAARPGAAQGRSPVGLGCLWDDLDVAGTQPVAGRCGWEAEQPLWNIIGCKVVGGPEECSGLSTATQSPLQF